MGSPVVRPVYTPVVKPVVNKREVAVNAAAAGTAAAAQGGTVKYVITSAASVAGATIGFVFGPVGAAIGGWVGQLFGDVVGLGIDKGEESNWFGLGSGGGNTGFSKAWVDFPQYAPGGSKYRSTPVWEGTNPNWFNQWNAESHTPQKSLWGGNLENTSNAFIRVLTKFPEMQDSNNTGMSWWVKLKKLDEGGSNESLGLSPMSKSIPILALSGLGLFLMFKK